MKVVSPALRNLSHRLGLYQVTNRPYTTILVEVLLNREECAMFEEEMLIGGGDRSIALETRCRRPIRNVIERDPGERERRVYERVRERFGKHWINRKPACGVYNCYGMVFASRRTTIEDDTQIPDVLGDDGYREIGEDEAVVGDLVLYQDQRMGMVHVARITRRGDLKVLYALSKWDSTSGEDEHHIRHHCWIDPDFQVELQFWTDRP